jgi:2-desacetyl-2-hydroxyethyl bacteriochlorophyllide A dehydrogenase
MKAVLLRNARELVVEDVPEPSIAPDEVLVKIAACGICGSDLHLYKHGSLSPDVRLGHESAGTIAQVGERVESFQVGERVGILGRVPCGECHWCRRGRHHVCPTRIDVRGGFSEYAAVKPAMLARLPDEVSFRQAAALEPMAVSLHGIRVARIGPSDGIVITGAGPIGLFAAALLRDMRARGIVVSEPSKRRRETAALWADRVLNPAEEDLGDVAREALNPCIDAVIECSGNARVLEDAFMLAGFAGKILLLGACLENVNLNPAMLLVREVGLQGSYGCDMDEYKRCLELVRSGRVNIDPIISGTVSQEGLADALERLCGPNEEIKLVMEI